MDKWNWIRTAGCTVIMILVAAFWIGVASIGRMVW